ncbi:helix-turn-helix transcriptional regulator [Ferrimonas gelatinilytica]|uniref:HTH luxR-type domain-containing protein n=1 Tax=Ferrimonas gelatinilytica TaxID=1255257 RepID=A0ABP9S558_9GAMM
MKSVSRYGAILVLASSMLFFAYDLATDLARGKEGYLHLAVEFIVFVAISAVLLRELWQLKRLRRAFAAEQDKNSRLAGELLSVIQQQFTRWHLSPSEAEIALLLIRGLSMKEIAAARQVKEKTVRLQASAVYAKSGCAGRHELSAYFIEDLMSNL